MNCPADLAFDQGKRLCDYKDAVDICRENVGTSVKVHSCQRDHAIVKEITTVTPVEEVAKMVIEETIELPSEETTVFPARDSIEQHGEDFFEHYRREPAEKTTVAVTEEPEEMTTETPTGTTKDQSSLSKIMERSTSCTTESQ
ncbi:unnamed protein product [Cylicocyclus nassatus]|uniref:Uncharacterized protein n=1 Tax=Cylicocyclus nassatus TaxID=53992 RepID=A0AA36HGU4_CYLNA|nr:unnamed protein product [Cylicocyclus nassatus]